MQSMSKVDPCHCHALRRAARSVTGFYDEALAPSGLRLSQFSMLAQLSGGKAVALGELAASLGLDRTTATRNLRLLERAGYVVIAAAEEDGRRKAIGLTEAGRAVLRYAFPLWEGAQAAFEDGHGATLVAQLRGTLRALESGRKTETGD